MNKLLLVTGGAGFVGSNLAVSLKEKYPKYTILAFDNLKRRGSELNIIRLKENGIDFIHGDIRCKEDFEQVGKVDVVIDASAEPSVLMGIEQGAEYLINTNLTGTVNCLNFAVKNKAQFIFLSTSRVYPIQTLNQLSFKEDNTRFSLALRQKIAGVSKKGISENFPLEGSRSLYGATKLASELIIQEYHSFLNLQTVINRCGVIAGPWQMGKVDQGFVALWVAKHYWKQPLSYIGFGGKGKQIRDLLHINDLFNLIDYQIIHADKINGQTFNIGGGLQTSSSLLEMTKYCTEITGNKIKIQQVKQNRPADIKLYYSDNSKAEKIMGWKSKLSVQDIVEDTFNWIHKNENTLKNILK